MEKLKKVVVFFILLAILISHESEIFATTLESVQNTKSVNESKLIEITKEQIHDENIMQISENNTRDASTLIDEQEKIPQNPNETYNGENLNLDTWIPSYAGEDVSCYIDLKAEYIITNIGYYDVNEEPTIMFNYGDPFKWQLAFSKKMDNYKKWNVEEVSNIRTRYLQIKVESGYQSGISEIAIYGYQVGEKEKDKEEVQIKNPDFGTTFDQSVGINGFIDDPIDILSVAGTIREYHNFSWTLDKLKENKFNPSYVSVWNFDNYYKKLKEAEIEVIPCLQGTSKSIVSNMTSRSQKPINDNDSSTNPQSYSEHASTMFQYAARYGSNKVDSSKLLLASDQEKISGLGYIKYYENWNEPDKTWEGNKSYFSPYELAAMCSADYDGHEKTLGDTYGIKNADSNTKLVMGGVANSKNLTKYLELMKFWAENNRTDKQLPFDVINFHLYTGKNSPENSEFETICKEIVNWRNQNAIDKEVWLTEFGWDTNSESLLGVSSQQTQRDWLVRTYLIANAIGIERSTMYMIRDTAGENETGKYATSGLTTQKGEWNKKSSWYGVYTLKNTLKDFKFKEIIQQNEDMYIYKFYNEETDEDCYVLWSPTQDGSKIDNYSLNIANRTNAQLTVLKDNSETGEQSILNIQNQNVIVNVTESPIFVKVSGEEIKSSEESKDDENQKQEEEIKPSEEQKDDENQKQEEEIKPSEEQKDDENQKQEEEIKPSEEQKDDENQKQEEEIKPSEEQKDDENQKQEEEIKPSEEQKDDENQKQEEEIKLFEEQKDDESLKQNKEIKIVDDLKQEGKKSKYGYQTEIEGSKIPKTGDNTNIMLLIALIISIVGIVISWRKWKKQL